MRKTILTMLTMAILACNSVHKPKEVAVFEGWPITHEAEFEIETVFIPVDEVGNYHAGEKVFIDTNGFIVDFPVRYLDGNTIHTDTTDLQRVVIHERVLPNKIIK